MNATKFCHAFLEISEDFLVTIGGASPECEVYSIASDCWNILPSLKSITGICSAFLFQSSIIYAFGHNMRDCDRQNGYFERLKLEGNFKKNEWEIITFDYPSSGVPTYEFLTFQISPSEFLIFSGSDNKGNATDKSTVFNTNTNTFSLHPSRTPLCYRDSTVMARWRDKKRQYLISFTGNLSIFSEGKLITICSFFKQNGSYSCENYPNKASITRKTKYQAMTLTGPS